jgi:hypothetical protein
VFSQRDAGSGDFAAGGVITKNTLEEHTIGTIQGNILFFIFLEMYTTSFNRFFRP